MHPAQNTKIQHYADGGLISKLFGGSKKVEAPQKKPQEPTMAPLVKGALDPKNALKSREEAAGLAKGGKVPGKSPSDTADNIPIMATAGEYMIKKKAVDRIGVKALDALNAVADGPGPKASKPKGRGAIRKMAQGGEVKKDDARFVRPARAPQMLANQSNPTSQAMVAGGRNPVPRAPVVPNLTTSPGAAAPTNAIPYKMPPEPIAATTSPGAAAPRPAVTPAAAQYVAPNTAEAPPRPITGGPTLPGTGPAPVAQVARAPYNPANASPEARAWQASRAPAPVPTVPAPQAPKYSTGQVVRGAIGNAAGAMAAGAGGALLANQTRDIGNPANQPSGTATMDPLVAQIPTGGIPGAGPTPATQPYNFYTDNEAGRNIGNLINAASAVPGLGATAKMARAAGAGAAAVQGFGAQVRADRESQATVMPVAPLAPAAAPTATAARTNSMGQGYDDPRRTDLDPSRASLGASRDFTRELNAVPQNLPADIQSGSIYKTIDPKTGQPTYSGRDVGANAGMVNGKGATVAQRGGVTTLDMSEGRAQVSRELARIEADKAKEAARGDEQELAAHMLAGNTTAARAVRGRMKRATEGRAAAALASTTGETQKLARDKFNVEAAGAAMDNKAKARLGALQDKVFNAKTPAEQVAAEDKLRAFQGKYEKPVADEYAYAPGGQEIDPATNTVVTRPGVIFNKRTGEPASGQASKPALPPGMVRQVGTSGGRPVYIDQNGKQVIAKAQ